MKYLIMVVMFVSLSVSAHTTEEFLDLIDETKKSVVFVENVVEVGSELPDGIEAPDGGDKTPKGFKSFGTGFVVAGGYIVTNSHVINNSEKLTIYLENNPHAYAVTLVGKDEFTDLAVLRPDDNFPSDIAPLQWREKELRLGSEVWALGHPANLTYSISKGIVSHLDRRINNPWQPTIQTDAAVNHGNSGGPLLDMDGNVVGVNVMILSKVGEFNGLALAINGSTAKHAVATLIDKGKIKRPFMGVELGIDDDSFKVQAKSVVKDGAGYKYGIEKNDIYLAINGIDINKVTDVFDILARKEPGDVITVEVLRNNNIAVIDITLGQKQ